MRTENEIDQQTASDRLYVGMQFALRREALGLSAETVAEQAGYSITQYTLMEEGKRSISASDYTFTFSLENGFKGKASSIEFKGTFQQKTATTDSSTFNGRKEIATHAGMIRKVQGEQLVSSKAVAKIWFNWWLVVALFVGSIFFLWTLHKLKGFAKRYTL